jgi:hypothetical protein
MERIVRFQNALIGSLGSRVPFGRTLHLKRLARPLVVELLNEGIELALPLQNVGSRRSRRFLFQRQVHTLMPAILLRVTRLDALDADAEP